MKVIDNDEFWKMFDELIEESDIVIDRPKGSENPCFKGLIYPVDYGYLENTTFDGWCGNRCFCRK